MRFSVENLAFAYGGRRVFEEISFTLEAGEVLCLLGPNGAGKSTLIKCLAGIFVPGAGEIRIDGASIRTMRRKEFARRVAYIPQSAAPVFPFPVRDIAAMGRTPHKAFFDQPDHRDYEMVRAALAELGIEHLEYKNCTELSGGERQMVLFAAAMVQPLARGWGLMMMPLRVFRAISVLKMAVEVGLVVGMTAATRPTGSATFLKA